ncbi:hypothetical protein K450DRAFT_221173 [Umbelopsis ramanniana AG]|uniref:Uncharacterized protein n=1 Tax=Umbelopsis ramanniana AG TaxID=1314678 RepID=A0AAD5EIU5_UMBRA|nr:uncharacterized protein K450DRAFT_221173 [Umbelopsis ramanniana AG]KAI8584029.1 hypothetical protein K450DRAFT_221173 [Umbelopsis ramanniana AG]
MPIKHLDSLLFLSGNITTLHRRAYVKHALHDSGCCGHKQMQHGGYVGFRRVFYIGVLGFAI